MRQRLSASLDAPESTQAQQLHGSGAPRGPHSGAMGPIAVAAAMQLSRANPVPAPNAQAVLHQSQQDFWCRAQAGEEQVRRPKWLAITAAIGGHLQDPAAAEPGLTDGLRCWFRPQHPGDVAAVVDLVIRCQPRGVNCPGDWLRI